MENKKIKNFDLNDNVDYHCFLLNGLFKNKDLCAYIMSFIANPYLLKKNILLCEVQLDKKFQAFVLLNAIGNAIFAYDWYRMVEKFERRTKFECFTYRQVKSLLLMDHFLVNDIEDFKEINRSKQMVLTELAFHLKQIKHLQSEIEIKEKKILQINDRLVSNYYSVEKSIKKQNERAKLYIKLDYDRKQIEKSSIYLSAVIKYYHMLKEITRFNNFVGVCFYGEKLN